MGRSANGRIEWKDSAGRTLHAKGPPWALCPEIIVMVTEMNVAEGIRH